MADAALEYRRDQLFRLLPRLYQVYDDAARPLDEEGRPKENELGPLRALLRVIGEQVNLLEDDLARWYDNWFIETCEDWVAPYLGDLVGYEISPHELGVRARPNLAPTVNYARREIADTIKLRRRKGTLALLDDLAKQTADWPAEAIEMRHYVAATAAINGPQPPRAVGENGVLQPPEFAPGTLNLRSLRSDDLTFHVPRLLDTRRADSTGTRGIVHPLAIGQQVYRRRVDSVTLARAVPVEGKTSCYRLSPLALDIPLHVNPNAVGEPEKMKDTVHWPVPLTREMLAHKDPKTGATSVNEAYYGPNKSLALWKRVVVDAATEKYEWRFITAEEIEVRDLTHWPPPTEGKLAVDLQTGRVALGPRAGESVAALASVHHIGRVALLGGGEYDRGLSAAPVTSIRVGEVENVKTLAKALESWKTAPGPSGYNVIECVDNNEESDPIVQKLHLSADSTLELRAANRHAPVLRVFGENFEIIAQPGSRLVLDGLTFASGTVRVTGPLAELVIRHCTLQPGKTTLRIGHQVRQVMIEKSVVGWIASHGAGTASPKETPTQIVIQDSILDPRMSPLSVTNRNDTSQPYSFGADRQPALAQLTLKRCTVFGRINVTEVKTIENSLCLVPVRVENTQRGIVRFSYVADSSCTPPRFHCADETPVSPQSLFDSDQFGHPDYARLKSVAPEEILQKADDGGEMGVYHDEYFGRRAEHLRQRLTEFVPAGYQTFLHFVN